MLSNSILKFISSLFILVAISSSIPAFADDVQNEELLKNKAQENDPVSWMKYGEYLYDKSYDTPELRDKYRKEAYSWIRKAADSGLPEAIFSLGYYCIGDKAPLYYYEQAALKGYAPAFVEVLDANLFVAGEDVKKAKEFADLARKMELESKIPRDLNVVDICYQAGTPEKPHDNGMWPGIACDECAEMYDTNSQDYKKCIFERGNNIDIATLYANGQLVKQDFWKAISYVCQGGTTPAELTSMVKILFEATQTGHLKEKFCYCNHASSSQSIAVCASRKNEQSIKHPK
ncbi:MAG: sel1 repeat family protein [Ignavibacteriae bacterium]|nr:sel1 repeat family protein [Ignavibacteriota bacterium]